MKKEDYVDRKRAQSIQEEILTLMRQEVAEMRELLGTLTQEYRLFTSQQFAENEQVEQLKKMIQEREVLLEKVLQIRSQRSLWFKQLQILYPMVKKKKSGNSKNKQEEIDWDRVMETSEVECSEIFLLKEQLFALIEKMQEQNATNQNLITQKLYYARNSVQKCLPEGRCSIYTAGGSIRPKMLVKTMTVNLLNQEG